jgi:hypothetical protein
MGIYKGLIFERSGEKNDNSAWFKLAFDAAPNDVIFNKTIVGKKFYELLTFGVLG